MLGHFHSLKMPKYIINSIILLVFLISAILFYFLNYDQSEVQILSKNTYPDSYLVDATYHRMDKTGKEFVLIKAENVQHFPLKNMTLLENPTLIIHNDDDIWRLKALHAQSKNEFDMINLSQQVEITRDESSAKFWLKASTDSLVVQPHLQLVETDKTVTIEQPGLKISGHGLLGNLKDGNLKLLKHMQSTITPDS